MVNILYQYKLNFQWYTLAVQWQSSVFWGKEKVPALTNGAPPALTFY